jgi:hypothetical protein
VVSAAWLTWNVSRKPSDELVKVAGHTVLRKCTMADSKKATSQITITANEARGALSPGETSFGDTLVPMLIGGLVLIVVASIVVMIFF